jgi:hypothetical protein
MGRSCTSKAADALAKAERQLCIGRASNVYRLSDGRGNEKQFLFEAWEEYDDGGMQFEVHKYDPEGETCTPFALVRIAADGSFDGGPLVWAMALRGDTVPGVIPPIET